MSVRAGTRLGSYEVVEPIGAGGMGEVSRARHIGATPLVLEALVGWSQLVPDAEAITLLAHVVAHEGTDAETRERAARMLTPLRELAGDAVYAEATNRGESVELSHICERLSQET